MDGTRRFYRGDDSITSSNLQGQKYSGSGKPDTWSREFICLPISDVLYRLFIANHVVILKLNPVNAYLGPLIEKGFRSLINQGFLRIVYGGAAEGTYLCNHPLVDEIHLTGSDKTFEAIIFGSGAEGAEIKLRKDR